MRKTLWLITGLISLLLGLIGVVLPLLPTTPFILLAAFSLANSSPKLHHWLMNHPHWGIVIKNWQDGGRIDRKNKLLAISCMTAMPLISYLFDVPMWALVLQTAILLAVGIFIVTRPS